MTAQSIAVPLNRPATYPFAPAHRRPAKITSNRFPVMLGHRLDLTSPAPPLPAMVPDDPAEASRFLGVHFACCDAYSRVYANRARTAYVGHCPRCAKRIEFPIGPGGTSARFFVAQ